MAFNLPELMKKPKLFSAVSDRQFNFLLWSLSVVATVGGSIGLYYAIKKYRREIFVLVISGPSGAGKSTLIQRLREEFPGVFTFSVSYTTRRPRPNEVDGVDYHFVSRDEMTRLIEANEFIEWTEFAGNMYGTSKSAVAELAKNKKVVILDLDTAGVRNVKNSGIDALYVSILPPSTEELRIRLQKRNTETDEEIEKRVRHTDEMFEFADAGNFDLVIVNEDLEEAYRLLRFAVHPLMQRYHDAGNMGG